MKKLATSALVLAMMAAPLHAGNVEPFVVVEEEVEEPAGSNAGWIILGLAAVAIGLAIALDDDDNGDDDDLVIIEEVN